MLLFLRLVRREPLGCTDLEEFVCGSQGDQL